MLKVINTSASPVGLINVIDGRVVLDIVESNDYRVVERLTDQQVRLADPALKVLKILIEEEGI